MPAAISSSGSDEITSTSTNTRRGCRNAPTRFFPAGVSTPVLPPTLLSTMASSVVGTWMYGIPRNRVAATNPATSPTTPPPTATTHASRPYPRSISRSWRSATVSRVLAPSPAEKAKHSASAPRSRRASASGSAYSGSTLLSVITAQRGARCQRRRSSAAPSGSPIPMTTSYSRGRPPGSTISTNCMRDLLEIQPSD